LFTALLDANVLVPVALTDTILRAAEKGLFIPRWSPAIMCETDEAIAKVRADVTATRRQARLASMDMRFPDASVSRYMSMVNDVDLPDPDDRHIVAAARAGHADIIVTRNIKDFPEQALRQFDLEVVDPDCFLLDMLDLFPMAMLEVVQEQANDTKRPPLSVQEVLESLEKVGVPQFAAQVRRMIDPNWVRR